MALMLLSAALPLKAQWSGRANFSTGLGGMMGREDLGIGFLGHVVTQGDVSLLYKTDKFSWNTTVGGSWESKSSDNSRLNMNLPQPDELGMTTVNSCGWMSPATTAGCSVLEFSGVFNR